MGDDIKTVISTGSDYWAALYWLSENQNKQNLNRCHHPLITRLEKSSLFYYQLSFVYLFPFFISWMLVWSCHFLPAWNFGHCRWMCKFSKHWSLHHGCTWKWQCLYFLHLRCTWNDQLIMLTCRNNFKSRLEKPESWV